MSANKITVIIPCFNTDQDIHRLTENTIESIKAARPDVELVIIDNGSTFGAGYLREVADIYVRNKENLGYPAAVNQGFGLANGNILCVSNNDVAVPKNIFDVGEEILKNSKVGSVHYKMIPYNQPFSFGDETWLVGKERWCTSSFFLIKKDVVSTVGNYDLNYGMGGYDDWDYWHRVRHIDGWMTAYTNKSAYQHYGSWTLSKMPQFKMDENGEYFKKKHGKYAEDIWWELYPEQMSEEYQNGFD